jgi:hypothetical protein
MMNVSFMGKRPGGSRSISFGASLVALAYALFCVSNTLLTFEDDRSQTLKLLAFGLVFSAITLRPCFHRRIVLLVPLILCLTIALARSFDAAAGREELLRFLAPVALTIALFSYRNQLGPIVLAFFAIVISNDIFQCYFYIAYALKLPVFLPIRIDSGLYLRAQGWMGFFSEFSFINFCAFLTCRHYQPTQNSKRASWIFLIFALCGFSFKIFATSLIYVFISRKLSFRSLLSLGASTALAAILVISGALDQILNLASAKLSFYVLAGNSARAESYRVMVESLAKGNLLGEGLGSFGGPASVRFNSPLYAQYHFDWYGLASLLTTTDTFYPHLFVELGWVGAAFWLAFVVFYGQSKLRNSPWIFIVGAFCFDNVFSLSFVSASYVFAALLMMYLFTDPSAKVEWKQT